jgi:hypothetical protein
MMAADVAGDQTQTRSWVYGGQGMKEAGAAMAREVQRSVLPIPDQPSFGLVTALNTKDGVTKFVYNVLGMAEFITEATRPIPAGEHQIRMEFACDGGGLGKGANVTLYYDGEKAGDGRVAATQPMIFSADETTDIGEDYGMPVTTDYAGDTSKFNGKIDLVQIDLGDDNHDHLIDPDEITRIALARQ